MKEKKKKKNQMNSHFKKHKSAMKYRIGFLKKVLARLTKNKREETQIR